MKNIAAIQTLNQIINHPNNQKNQLIPILKYFGWKLYKALTHRHLDTKILPSVKIRCYPKSLSSDCVINYGLYDYNEMIFLLRYLRDGDSFVDVGANIGVYTLLAASKIHFGLIYSFEALAENYIRLQENLRLNHFEQVKTYPIAISDKVGEISFNPAGGDALGFISNTTTSNTITVPTDTLDNLILNSDISKFTLAKMDIEGAELLALKGATSLLKQQRPYVWILEINYRTVKNFGRSEKEVVDFLQSYGYGLYHYDVDTNQIIPITWKEKKGDNVLAIASPHLDFVRNRLSEI
ncbi:MAG: FkbM family methyltransferase [Xenococcaceae cyanobacterium MO_188.B32]|nr:FkbM family methyltransferase [Xenococcaceae cyanobacterium MO_188.B32]